MQRTRQYFRLSQLELVVKWTFRWAIAPLLLFAATSATSAASPLKGTAATVPTKLAATPKRSAAAIRVMQQLADFLIGLNSSSELTADNVGQRFGVTLTPESGQSAYRSADLGGGWNYGIGVSPASRSMKQGFNFWLYNPLKNADPTPVCVLSLDALRKQLVAHGYAEKFAPSEIGGIDWVDFERNDIVLTVTRRDLLVAASGDECFSGLQTTDG